MRIDAIEIQRTTKTDKQWSLAVFDRKVFCQIYRPETYKRRTHQNNTEFNGRRRCCIADNEKQARQLGKLAN